MSYFYEQIVDILRKVKDPSTAANEVIQMLEDEGVLESEEDDEDFEDEEEYGITENPFDPSRD
jgi:hypothetical protein